MLRRNTVARVTDARITLGAHQHVLQAARVVEQDSTLVEELLLRKVDGEALQPLGPEIHGGRRNGEHHLASLVSSALSEDSLMPPGNVVTTDEGSPFALL